MSNIRPKAICALVIAVSLYIAFAAQAEPIPQLPLQRGYYVDATVPCANADNSSLYLVTKEGINSAQAVCKISKIERTEPTVFSVTDTCMDLVSGSEFGETTTTYMIPDDHSFGFYSAGEATGITRFCAQSELPEPFSTNDISDILR